MAIAARSSGAEKWMFPETSAWTRAPPSASSEITSPVAARMTSGPAMNILALSSTMTMKSVRAGE